MGSKLQDKLAEATDGSIPIDFSGASEKKSFEPLPEGDYEAVITRAEVGTSKKGDPKVVVTWKVTEGEHAGRLVFDHVTAVGDNYKLRDTLDTIGIETAGMTSLEPGDMVGGEAILTIVISETDQGTFNNVKRAKALPGAKPSAKRSKRI